MLKIGLSAALLVLAAPALAQDPQGGPTPPPAFMASAQAFGQCVGTGIGGLAATVTPEAGATQVLAACATQRTALETQFEAWVASPAFPEAARAPARAQFRERLAGAEAQIAAGIRQGRTSGAPAAAH